MRTQHIREINQGHCVFPFFHKFTSKFSDSWKTAVNLQSLKEPVYILCNVFLEIIVLIYVEISGLLDSCSWPLCHVCVRPEPKWVTSYKQEAAKDNLLAPNCAYSITCFVLFCFPLFILTGIVLLKPLKPRLVIQASVWMGQRIKCKALCSPKGLYKGLYKFRPHTIYNNDFALFIYGLFLVILIWKATFGHIFNHHKVLSIK